MNKLKLSTALPLILVSAMMMSSIGVAQAAPTIGPVIQGGGATYQVDRPDDVTGGACNPSALADCSFRDAVDLGNGNAGHDIVNLMPGEVFTLTLGSLVITDNLTINGFGSTVSAGGLSRVLDIQTAGDVTISDLTVENGHTTTISEPGAGIRNLGSNLSLNNVTVQDNSSWVHGGISIPSGTATIINSSVMSNTSVGTAGGIGISASGMVTVTNSIIAYNSGEEGGGINNRGVLTVDKTSFFSNTSTYYGGGIAAGGMVTITNSAFYNNRAQDGGGGISIAGTAMISNTTISGNSTTIDGGGIFNAGYATVTNSTIFGNTAGDSGGNVAHSIIVGSTIIGGGLPTNCSQIATQQVTVMTPPMTSLGYNLVSDGSCALTKPTDQIANPLLAPLAANGGPTLTHAFASGMSPAINRGDNTSCPAFDQRGFSRPFGPRCDVGALEDHTDWSSTIKRIFLALILNLR